MLYPPDIEAVIEIVRRNAPQEGHPKEGELYAMAIRDACSARVGPDIDRVNELIELFYDHIDADIEAAEP